MPAWSASPTKQFKQLRWDSLRSAHPTCSLLAEDAALAKLLEAHLAIERLRGEVVLHCLDFDLVRAVADELAEGLP